MFGQDLLWFHVTKVLVAKFGVLGGQLSCTANFSQ